MDRVEEEVKVEGGLERVAIGWTWMVKGEKQKSCRWREGNVVVDRE